MKCSTLKRLFRSALLATACLAVGSQAAEPEATKAARHGQTPSIRYLLTQPDGGEDTFWTWPNHNDTGWQSAAGFKAVSAALKNARAAQVWIRMDANLTAEAVNNSFFRIRHSGAVEIYVNGLKRVAVKNASFDFQDYPSGRRRPEAIGRNVFAIHFQSTEGADPVLDIEWISNPWSSPPKIARFPDPVLPDLIRDAQVCRGPDGTYYLTGTTGDETFLRPGPEAWLRSPGIQMFKSADLRHWQSLGWVWTFERDGTWNKEFGTFGGRGPARGIFAPEIHYLKEKLFATVWCYPDHDPHWQKVSIVPMRCKPEAAKQPLLLPMDEANPTPDP